jgi:hypothetical protein
MFKIGDSHKRGGKVPFDRHSRKNWREREDFQNRSW